MGSALLTFMLFLGVMLVLRSVIFGIIPRLMDKKKRKDNPDEKEQN